MNLSVTYMHFFLEAPYADVIRTSICILAGVNPPMLFLIMAIDGTWGAFIHVGENVLKDARMGWLGRLILTPSHHRVHHARNAVYIDTNFCNLLNIWDRVFRTYQPEDLSVRIEYGITRPVKTRSFMDMYFGNSSAWDGTSPTRRGCGTNCCISLCRPAGAIRVRIRPQR